MWCIVYVRFSFSHFFFLLFYSRFKFALFFPIRFSIVLKAMFATFFFRSLICVVHFNAWQRSNWSTSPLYTHYVCDSLINKNIVQATLSLRIRSAAYYMCVCVLHNGHLDMWFNVFTILLGGPLNCSKRKKIKAKNFVSCFVAIFIPLHSLNMFLPYLATCCRYLFISQFSRWHNTDSELYI